VELVYNRKVAEYLQALPDQLRIEVYDALRYFERFGTAAQLPDVAPIVSLANTWETRTQMTITGRRYTIRVLIKVHSPTKALATVAGDKDQWNTNNGDWYQAYGPISDAVYATMKDQL
jgi:hypothetical protein